MLYQKASFVISETARFQIEETPMLKAVFKSFETGIRAKPANIANGTADGANRYRLVKGWGSANVIGMDNGQLVYSVLSVEPIQDVRFGDRVRSAMLSIARNYVPHAQEAADAAGAFRGGR